MYSNENQEPTSRVMYDNRTPEMPENRTVRETLCKCTSKQIVDTIDTSYGLVGDLVSAQRLLLECEQFLKGVNSTNDERERLIMNIKTLNL